MSEAAAQAWTTPQWVERVSAELGVGPIDSKAVLDLTRDVAHGVERPAAPLTCLLVGLAVGAGADLATTIERVRALLPGER